MNYPETVDWILNRLPMFQRSGQSAYKKDLDNIKKLCTHLGNPQHQFRSIHIAGTNGKGSTSHMLAAILQESGLKVGLTTSPHLVDFRERIRLNGKLCTEDFVVDFIARNSAYIETLQASFFEVSIAMAFTYFAQEKVDVAVIETGLGGRLDSTNLIHPILSVITNIGMDHTAILGHSLEEIAAEKAGIIKENTAVVIGETTEVTKPIFEQKAKETNSEIIFAEDFDLPDYESDLKGIYQKKNRRTVWAAIQELRKLNFEIPETAVVDGLKQVKTLTGLKGRWEILQEKPLIVADTGHNPHGLSEVRKQIAETEFRQLHLVLGFVNDKDVESILTFFPKDAKYYFSSPDVPRRLTVEDLRQRVSADLDANFFESIGLALEAAKAEADEVDMIYVGGSTFVVAEVV